MLFIELMVPQGVFDAGQRRELAGRLTARRLLSDGDGQPVAADPGVLDLFDSLTHVVVREEDVWLVGGRPLGGDEPRYVVNVIAGMWGKEIGEHLITRITAELTDADASAGPDVVVNVISLPEGSYGLHGRARRSPDMLQLIEQAKSGPGAPAGDDHMIDPVCGATVPIADAVILEHDGRTYGFCCAHCRGHFAKQLKTAGAS